MVACPPQAKTLIRLGMRLISRFVGEGPFRCSAWVLPLNNPDIREEEIGAWIVGFDTHAILIPFSWLLSLLLLARDYRVCSFLAEVPAWHSRSELRG